MITKERFESGYTYTEYRKLVDELFANGRTTGPVQSQELLDYTDLNIHRMKRIDKHTELDEEMTGRLKNIPCPVNWLVIAEAWCGDAAQNLPILNKMAEMSPNIRLRIILRDENLDIIDAHLTNGGRAIPKLIVLDHAMEQIATWGPRPKEIQDAVMENKRTGEMPYSEFAKVVQKWYAADKGRSLEHEMMDIISKMECVLDERP